MSGAMLDKLFDTIEASNGDVKTVWIAALSLGVQALRHTDRGVGRAEPEPARVAVRTSRRTPTAHPSAAGTSIRCCRSARPRGRLAVPQEGVVRDRRERARPAGRLRRSASSMHQRIGGGQHVIARPAGQESGNDRRVVFMFLIGYSIMRSARISSLNPPGTGCNHPQG